MLKKLVFFVLLANFALADGGPAAVEKAPEHKKEDHKKEAPKKEVPKKDKK